jgi:hypothetical protein
VKDKDIRIALHKFSTSWDKSVIKTMIPPSGLIYNNYPPASISLKLSDVDYNVPNVLGSKIDVPYFIPPASGVSIGDANAYSEFITPPVSFGLVIKQLEARTLSYAQQYQKINNPPPISVRPFTQIADALLELKRDRIDKRKHPEDTAKVVVLITDGIENNNDGGRLMDPNSCEALKSSGVIMMVLHSYYRFQPGSDASDVLRRNISSSEPKLYSHNVDAVEERINKGPIRNALQKCASINEKGKTYYFPANNAAQLTQAFLDILKDMEEITLPTEPSPQGKPKPSIYLVQ